MKRILAGILLVLMLCLGVQLLLPAARADESGSCGDGVIWSYEESTQTLTISGQGSITGYKSAEAYPWHHLRSQILHVKMTGAITNVPPYAFAKMSVLQTVTFSPTVSTIGNSAFTNCLALESIPFPDGLTTLDGGAFLYCPALTNLVFPDSLQTIGINAFASCGNLQTVQFGSGLKDLGSGAFQDCKSLTSVILPEGLIVLDNNTFLGCSALTSVTLPGTLEVIGQGAFTRSGLSTLVIPETVTQIGKTAFSQNPSLENILFLGGQPESGEDVLRDSPNAAVYVTKAAKGWEDHWQGAPVSPVDLTVSSTVTCTEPGAVRFLVEDIGLDITLDALPLGHALDLWELQAPATTEGNGLWHHKCSRCGYYEKYTIPAFLALEDRPAFTKNQGDLYTFRDWSDPICSYLEETEQGYLRIESFTTPDGQGVVSVEQYDRDFNFLSRFNIPWELPLFGGYYTDGSYRYIVYGQENLNEDDSVEVFRVVRYNMDWQRMDCASLYGENTTIPFWAGCLRMTHYEDLLYIRTCHRMYRSLDGKNHQASVFLVIKTPTMEVQEAVTAVPFSTRGYVSHSFNQFIFIDGNDIMTLDHGDANPRAAVMMRYDQPAGALTLDSDTHDHYASVETVVYAGKSGDNYTGAKLGGFEYSDSAYLVAGADRVWDGIAERYISPYNIYISVTPKDAFTQEDTQIKWITQYPQTDERIITSPFMIKLENNRFLLMWTEDKTTLKSVFIDGEGNTTSDIYTTEAMLSDCTPIVVGDSLVWYVTEKTEPTFYTLDLSDPSKVTAKDLHTHHTFGDWVVMWEATYDYDGFRVRECGCGAREEEVIPRLERPADPTEPEKPSVPSNPVNPFTDVKAGKYYYDAVLWAVDKGITTGKTATTFEPNEPCTRKQIVTFLWRAAGQPEPASRVNPFTDIPEGKYYTDAVLWAYYAGITTGKTATTFAPDAPCTRAQIVTFLWRSMEKPTPENTNNPFDDVPDGKYYTNAVLWALENGITTGKTQTTFLPEDTCTRCQIVTFLYRAMAEEN